MKLLLETDTIRDIPVLSLAPDAAQHCPAVFYIPGFGASKESGLNLAYQLARAGLFFIGLDPWMHGARYDERLHRAAEPEWGGVYPPDTGLDTGWLFYQIIQRCLVDVQTLLEHYAADSRVDVTRCGVTGPSMGGYASFLIFANLPSMQAAVPMVGIPSFGQRWLDIIDECSFSNSDWAAALQDAEAQVTQHTAFVRALDPVEKLRAAAPRALLIMNCDFDYDQPKSYSIACYRDLRSAYAAHPDKLKLNIYPAAHTVTPPMENDAVAWFGKHLLG
jgi:hypothetical protein